MANRNSRLQRSIALALLGMCLAGNSVYAAEGVYTSPASDFSAPVADDVSQEVAAATEQANYMTDAEAEAELASLEKQLAELEEALAKERGTIEVEKEKVAKEPNKWAIHGDARLKYEYFGDGEGAKWRERARLAFTHDLNDKVTFYTRWGLMNDNPMGYSEHFAHKINTYSSKNYASGYTAANVIYPDLDATDGSWVLDANLQLKDMLGKDTKLTIGRFGQTFGATGMYSDEDAFGGIDGVKLTWGNDIVKELTVGYAKFGASQHYPDINSTSSLSTGLNYTGTQYLRKPLERAFFVNTKLALTPALTLHGMWVKEDGNGRSQMISTGSAYTPWFYDNPNNHDVRGVGITAQLSPNLKLVGDYLIDMNQDSTYLGNGATSAAKSKTDYKTMTYDRQKAEYVSLRYKEAKWGDKGSFGINLDWRNVSPASHLAGYVTATNDYYVNSSSLLSSMSVADDLLVSEGIRGPVVGFNYMINNNLKLSFMQSFANTLNYYNFRFADNKVGSTHHYNAYVDDLSTKADNMTVIALTGRF